jgi:toxin ParE1/3/4
MANYSLSNKAIQDISDIWNYTYDTWSERQADKYYALILDVCKVLAAKPAMGKNYPEVHADILGYKAHQHIIFYTITSIRNIFIVRILHNRMDLKRKLADE